MRSSTSRPGGRQTPQTNVNDRLHTLRLYRHAQNLNKARAYIASTSATSHRSPTTGTLPTDYTLILPPPLSTFFVTDTPIAESSSTRQEPRKKPPKPTWAGPTPPRSWVLTSSKDEHDTPEWRSNALSLVMPSAGCALQDGVPPLTLICLRALRSLPTSGFVEEIIPYLPPHLRCQMIRDSAVYSPLSDAQLYPLLESNGCVNGELVVVGPQATMHETHFRDINKPSMDVDEPDEAPAWDSPSHDASQETLQMLAIISARLSVSTMLTLPPTLSHLALVHLPSPIPVHRLPLLCPLIVVLDLSYNGWLGYRSSDEGEFHNPEGIQMLERVDWKKWQHLKVLGLRGCMRSESILAAVNKGRWDDVETVW
ncbi:hypothetical protein CCMSSC00406_0005028 [Pleurotus cornucopiae]|uniref:Uncharacterized protein n=1 Tax=Pleurotus cornucopiae TaxID=5321 RepID=A0ACB7J696_PLECO|nr:hypothetical protein CCMSSC00406_0005028 [Pleurotus cornucopiae]